MSFVCLSFYMDVAIYVEPTEEQEKLILSVQGKSAYALYSYIVFIRIGLLCSFRLLSLWCISSHLLYVTWDLERKLTAALATVIVTSNQFF